MQTSPIFRVFVSSTFEDFTAERNALAGVFRELGRRCESRGARFQAIDLRWGVSEEASLDQQTMTLCLQEIARSREVTPRPNFIALLGDRYGWRPLPDELQDDEFARIVSLTASGADRALLADWYRRDDNARPPSWVLRHRKLDVAPSASPARLLRARREEARSWRATEDRLRRVLLRGAERAGLDRARLVRYGTSASHQEIEAGVFEPKGASGQVFAFLRSIRGLPAGPSAARFLDLDARGRPDRAARRALADLRRELLERLPSGNVFEYEARWEGRGVSTDHVGRLCRDVGAALWGVLEAELESFEGRDPLEVEVAAHRAFAEERRSHFTGRVGARRAIAAYLAGAESGPLLVRGPAGSGKSALLARAAADAAARRPRPVVVSRFIGATAASTAGVQLLRGICDEIGRAVGTEDPAPPAYRELVAHVRSLLERASEERPLILFVDALDQLATSDPARELGWLPSQLPDRVRVVLSALTTPARHSGPVLELEPMANEEGERLLDRWLASVARTLTREQRGRVLERFGDCPLPLYLRLAFEEARRWRSDDPPGELAPETEGLIDGLLARLGDDSNHGRMLVERSLGYLAAARSGLTEDEVVEVLSRDRDVMDDFRRRSPESPKVDRLPPIVWSRLRADLEPYLAQRSADGTSTLGFYHRQLADVVAREFLGPSARLARSRSLARFFEAQPSEPEAEGHRARNVRKLAELPFLQTRGALWQRLEGTLCDLDFVTVKVAAGLTYDLVEDYAAAERALPETRLEERRTAESVARLARYARELEEHARQWTDARRRRSPAAAPADCPAPPPASRPSDARDAFREPRRAAGASSRIDRIRAFSQFVNTESHRLAAFGGEPSYVVQQAYNSGGDGPLGQAAEARVAGAPPAAPAVLARRWSRPVFEPRVPIVRTFDNWVDEGGVVALTPDALRAVSDSGAGFRTWDVATGRQLADVETDGSVDAVALTAGGTRVVTGNGDRTVCLWDADTGRSLTVLRGHADRPGAVCVTPDGGLIASGGSWDDHTVRIWDPLRRDAVRVLEGHEAGILSLAVTADGSRVFSGSEDNTVRVWDVASGRCLKVLRAHREPVGSLAVTPCGRRLATCGRDEKAIVWDLERLRRIARLAPDALEREPLTALALTADGGLVIGARRSGLVVFDAETGEALRFLEPPAGSVDAIDHVAINAEGSLALTGSYNGILSLWDVTRGHHEITFEGANSGSNVVSVAFVANGGEALVASEDGTLVLHGARNGDGNVVRHGGGAWVASASISGDGARVLAGFGDGTIGVFSRNGRRRTLRTSAGYVGALAVGPDGRQVLAGGDDGTLRLWDLGAWRLLPGLGSHPGAVFSAAIAADGILAVSASSDGFGGSTKTLLLWNLATAKPIRRAFHGDGSVVSGVAFAPDGRSVVTGGVDSSVRVWNVRSGECLHVLEGHDDEILGVAVSADGARVVSGSRDRTIRVWDMKSGGAVAVAGLSYVITSLALSGRELVVGGQSGNLRQFELRDPDEGPGRTTLGYAYDHVRRAWEPGPRAQCPWCGRRFAPHGPVSDAVEALTASVKPGRSPCLELPDDAFAEPALRSACPGCGAALVFNPFVLDRRSLDAVE